MNTATTTSPTTLTLNESFSSRRNWFDWLFALIVAAGGLFALQRYAVYGSDGSIRFDLPWKQTEEPSGPSAPDGASRRKTATSAMPSSCSKICTRLGFQTLPQAVKYPESDEQSETQGMEKAARRSDVTARASPIQRKPIGSASSHSTAVAAVALWVAVSIVPGLAVRDGNTLLLAAIVHGIVNATVRPFAVLL